MTTVDVDGTTAASDPGTVFAAVVAVLDDTGAPHGAGFLAADRTVLTCAHVVLAAGAGPGGQLRLAFSHLPGSPRLTATVDPRAWRPADGQDVAVLRLAEDPPGVRAVALGSASGCSGHRVAVFGFPDGAPAGRFGYARAGDLLPDAADRGALVQLTAANDVTVGFSGAPVVDETTGLVIGMVTAIQQPDGYRRGSGVAYATATQTLRRVDPGLVEVAVCPYRGLAPFTAEHTAWFHGRAEAVRRVVAALGRQAVLLLGPSGSGKSSLIHAGVLPALAAGRSGPWTVVSVRPGRDLLAELERAGLAGTGAGGIVAGVRGHLAGQPTGSRLLLVIDQFEELLTGSGGGHRLAELDTALRGLPALHVVLVMRDDFYPRLAATAPALLDVLAAGLVNVPAALTGAELRAIITRPAADVGLRFEPGLVDQIICDLEAVGADTPDRQVPVTVLPLLQLALLQLWERRVDGRLTHAGYLSIGRVAGSLTGRCDQSIAALPADQRPIARRMLTALVRPADPDRQIPAVRRQVPVDDLRELATDHAGGRPGAVEAVLRALTTTTPLIVTHAPAGGPAAAPVAELVHDALIRDWATLHDWVGQDSRFHDWLRRAEEQQPRWADTADPADLLHGSALAEGIEWSRQRRLPTPVVAFLTASQRAAQARVRRGRILSGALAVLLVLVVGAAVTLFGQRQAAVEAQLTALSRQLAAQSQIQAAGNPDLSALLAVHAHRISATRDGLSSLYAAASAIQPLRHTLVGHTSVVRSAAFSPDGRTLATAGADNTVRLWNVASRTSRVVRTGHTELRSAAFSPDGRTLATAGGDATVRLWDAATGAGRGSLAGHDHAVNAVTFSPDGSTLAAAGTDHAVRLWDVAARTVRATFSGHTDTVNAVAFSPDGRILATASGDTTARLWNVAARTRRAVLTRHRYAVNAVAFSPDGRTLATASDDNTVRLWDASTAAERGTLTGHTDSVNAVAFSPDGRTLATASDDNTARLWNVASHARRTTLTRHTDPVNAVAFSPDGRTLATASDDNTARLWNLAGGASRTTLTGRADVRSVAFSPDGTTLATASGDNAVRLWDVATHARRATLRGHTDTVWSAAFSPDGRTLATAGIDRTVRLWDVATRTRRAILKGHTDAVWSVAFSPDGTTLATASGDDTVRLWDVATHALRATLKGHTDAVWSVAFSPDGTTLATASRDNTARLWDVATRTGRAPLTGHTATVNAVAFSPDGTTLATAAGDNTVRLWDNATGTARATVPVASYAVNAVAFSPDGRTLATAGDDGTARLWDPATGTSKATLTGHTDTVNAVAFSPDGRTLATGSGDHTARLWDVTLPEPGVAVDQICSAVGTEISPAEYAMYLPGQPVRQACP